jgi:hypothetical protein
MRKIYALALASCLTLSATAALAQTATAPAPTTTATSASAATTATSASATTTTTHKATHHVKHKRVVKKAASHKVTGDVSKMDCTANTVTVDTTDLVIATTTTFTLDGKKATCADVKDGSKATATYTTKDGKNNASRISAKSAK